MNARVMVVEDDPDCLEAIAAALEYSGYAAVTAANGLDALERLEATPGDPPRLIFVDLMMPVMDGWKLVNELRKRPSLARIPVVLLSAERELARKADELGTAGYLRKPVTLDDLLSATRRLIELALES